MLDSGENGRKIKLRRGRCIAVTAPCVIILPHDCPVSAVILHAFVNGEGEVKEFAAPTDIRDRK